MLKGYQKSFGKVAAILYISGGLMHGIRLLIHFTPADIPFFTDWVVAVGGLYAGAGFLLFRRYVDYRGMAHKVVYALITFHLLGSALLHIWIILTHSHKLLTIFPLGYSYAAVIFFLAFAWVAGTLRFRNSEQATTPLGDKA